MARLVLTTPGEDGAAGGNTEVFGTSAGDEVITVLEGADVTFDGSFLAGGDTIRLPGVASDYTVHIVGSRVELTSTDGTTISLPVGANANTLEFEDGAALDIAIVDGHIQIGDQVIEDGDTIGGGVPGAVTLTEGTDVVEGSVFNAPRGFTPGGTDQVNTLNDDDELTGIGDNAVLNFTFVNDVDSGDMDINPTMTNVRTVNIAARFDVSGTLDLQDSQGVQNVNVTGLDDAAVLTVDNIQAIDGNYNLSISDSNADDGGIFFVFDEDAVEAADQTVNLALDGAELDFVVINDVDGQPNLGFENVNVSSTGEDSEIEVLAIEDAETLTITGDADLSLGSRDSAFRAGSNQVEAWRYGAGLEDVAGSLTVIDASDFEGDLVLNIGDEALADLDELSDGKVNLQVLGGSGDDTFRLLGGFDTDEDLIDAGEGDDTLQVFASVANGSISNVELLDIRNGQDDDSAGDLIEIDASLFDDALAEIWIRNEGMFFNGGLGRYDTGNDEVSEVELSNLSAAQATNIHFQHSTTGNNGLTENILRTFDTDGDTVGIFLHDKIDGENRGINTDPRFNIATALDTENVTITDVDSESNSISLDNFALHTGTVTVEGAGQAGRFMNLDVFDDGAGGWTNLYGHDTTGDDNDATGNVILQDDAGFSVRLVGDIDSTTYTGNVIARVGGTGAQTISYGAGNDTLVWDLRGNNTAGLTVLDTADGGAGTDTIAFEGDVRITIGASEWEGVSNFETILLIGNGIASSVDGDVFLNEFGENAYNIRLTNDLLDNNGVANGDVRSIHIRNDNNDGGTNNGVTIDATQLANNRTFSYDGEEGAANATADRFIMSDANINGNAVIDGGAAAIVGYANEDILEVRATSGGLGAQVTIDDLANISNVSELQFTNFTGSDVDSFLALDNATIERLVNTAHAAVVGDEEVLTVSVWDNQSGGGETTLELNLDDYVAGQGELIAFEGDGNLEIDGIFDFAAAEAAGLDFDDFTGTVTFVDSGEQVIFGTAGADTLTGTGAGETIIGGNGADTINGLGGADDLRGGNGADTIDGGAGADRITGGNGGDTLTGGGAGDTFAVAHGESIANNNGINLSYDRITDFDQAGDDVIELVGVAAFSSGDILSGAGGYTETTLVDFLEGQVGNAGFFGPYDAIIYTEATGTGVLIDSNSNGGLDANDIFIWLEDPQAVTIADFTFA
jgi:hypothetical protein